MASPPNQNGHTSGQPHELQLVRQPIEIRAALRVFNTRARSAADRSQRILAQTSYWVYDPDTRAFGPSKFVGFAGMDFGTYESAVAGKEGGAKFDGHVTKVAIEKALGARFQPDAGLADRLSAWSTTLLGSDVFERVDTSKWQFITLPAERGYWAILANPDVYRVEEAVAERDTALWTVQRGHVRAGDRVAIWKAKGSGIRRGVIAIGEVLTEPADLEEDPTALQYWRDGTGTGPQRRVRVRHVRPPRAPLWLEEDASGVLANLSVARATGGSVYRIEPEQWTQLIDALGGWPEEDQEEATAEAAWEARARARGQGFAASPAVRKAVEEYAMQLAEKHYREEYEVKRKGKPYDLLCTHRTTGAVLYVEVKGTTTAGEEVFLTPNEVRFARENAGQMALFVQSGIVIEQSEAGDVTASGGTTRIWEPWDVDAGALTPMAYVYAVPAGS
jgi:hypothetical protein